MGRSVVMQPDGKFAVFSSIVDSLVLADATEEETFEFLTEDTGRRQAQELIDEAKGDTIRYAIGNIPEPGPNLRWRWVLGRMSTKTRGLTVKAIIDRDEKARRKFFGPEEKDG